MECKTSLVKIKVDLIVKACTEMQAHILKRREDIYVKAIYHEMHHHYKGWWNQNATISLIEATLWVDDWKSRQDPDSWIQWVPKFIGYNCKEFSMTRDLLDMCEFSCEDSLYLGIDDLKFIKLCCDQFNIPKNNTET
jgi:hypothetical protein